MRSGLPTKRPLYRRHMSLASRLYLIGILQFVGIVLASVIVGTAMGPPSRLINTRLSEYAVHSVLPTLQDPDHGQREMARINHSLGAFLTLYDQHGKLLATNRAVPDPPVLSPADVPLHKVQYIGGQYVVSFALPSGGYGHAVFTAQTLPSVWAKLALISTVVMLLVGVSSLLSARMLSRPLKQLTATARALGAGQLGARARLARSDEFGEVAQAFDEMADQIESLLRSQKELLANVSHELLTPIARIRVALDLASEGDPVSAQQSVCGIADDLAELTRLVDDVLITTRLELAEGRASGGTLPRIHSESVDLVTLLRYSCSLFRKNHPHRELELTLDPALSSIPGDPPLLRRVVDNLLQNAARYSDPGDGPIQLYALQQEHEVIIGVRDQGIGISAEDLPKIFMPFFRSDRSRCRATGGQGLGLAFSKRVVEAHGGGIEVQSSLGVGTELIVRLPCESQPTT